MLNLTQLLSISGSHYSEKKAPVIVWNLTKSCNLNCSFCYYDAKIGEIGTDTIPHKTIEQLKQAKIKFVLLSGGEPLLYAPILDLVENLTSSSIRVGISTNGTLIDKKVAYDLKKSGADYIGISLDGLKETHDRLRNSKGVFDKALNGLRNAQGAGLKTGIRMTLNSYNYGEIGDFFSLVEGLGVARLCFYHLVYSGRAKEVNNDLSKIQRRQAIETIIKLTVDWIKRKVSTQVLTVDNFSDAVILLEHIRRTAPKNYSLVFELLKKQGGCPAGKGILSLDHEGNLHPCQFWQSQRLASLTVQSGLFNNWKSRLKGKCARCDYQDICGGCRVRAYQRYGDFWQEDPSCCLSDDEYKDETHLVEHN